MKLAIFASGNGSNFAAIAEAVKEGTINAELVLLFCDKRQAYVIQRSQELGISTICFEPKDFVNKAAYEQELLQILKVNQVDLVVLAGYMRLIGPTLLKVYSNRILNIHPALLPDFPGLHGIRDAFEAGVIETGVTVHFVDDGVDTGPIVAQESVFIDEKDTLEMLEERIHQVEHQVYPKVIQETIEKLSKTNEWKWSVEG
ncbi:phosphoribosylglycinamide formyltransferase [Carnobacterium gallinarum]|uniref:phosphoribosylglycinamide formyltransferase n=1 Tax=Carnobacterium gallinarum TaxID=2749 RepID=UPI000559748C|nr:phosphoribosylglycinamide formyltransferase [Carnobacterium gallinarum]